MRSCGVRGSWSGVTRKPRTMRMSGGLRTATPAGCHMIRRRWEEARAKVEAEGACRALTLGGCEGSLESAHNVGRAHDREVSPGVLYVDPDDVVPMCSRHPERYDAHGLGLLPF